MLKYVIMLFGQFQLAKSIFNHIGPHGSELDMTMKEQVKFHGYPFLEYQVVTTDGYKIGLHRIPGPKGETVMNGIKNSQSQKREVVLIGHGMLESSQTMVISGPGEESAAGQQGKAMPYQLVDTGRYDVWMLNQRGNYYSRDHLWLDPDSEPEFWDFSFSEMAEFDMPAVIDFIQSESRSDDKITYIGYSQGATIGFWGMNTNPEYYESKVKLFVAIAPAVMFEYTRETKILEFADEDTAQYLIIGEDFLEFGGKNKNKPDPFIKYIKKEFPTACSFDPEICDENRFYTSKESVDQSPSINIDRMDKDRVDLFMNTKGGTSSKNLIHMGQIMKFNRF